MRTIQFFYHSDSDKAPKIMADICAGTQRAPATVYKWMNGERVPCYLEQRFIQKVIRKYFEQLVPLEELFYNSNATENDN